MVLGFNHNVVYKGEVFHVQTEDSGVNSPHIITLLYRGGVILCSQKTSYADIVKMESLDTIVEELMKEQHKNMMRRLKIGEFDDKAFSINPTLIENYEIEAPKPSSDPVADVFSVTSSSTSASSKNDISMLFELPADKSAAPPQQPPRPDFVPGNAISLDDAILSFFGANEKKP